MFSDYGLILKLSARLVGFVVELASHIYRFELKDSLFQKSVADVIPQQLNNM